MTSPGQNDEGSSSSDDNDSTAAALAAAIGHSPQPVPEAASNGGDPDPDAMDVDKEAETSKDPPTERIEEEVKKQELSETKATVEGPEGQEAAAAEHATKEIGTPQAPKVEVQYRIRPDISLNERDADEITALHIAIHSRSLDKVKLLLEAGANFRLRNDGSYPLHTAISIGALKQHRQYSYECSVALVEAGADLTAKDDSNHTPLFLACMYNLPQIVSYILTQDEGISALNSRADRVGNRPLHVAARFDTVSNATVSPAATANATGQSGRVSITGSAASIPAPIPGFPGKLVSTEVRQAESRDQMVPIDSLVTQNLLGTPGIEVDAPNALGQTALHIACSRGNWPVARLLLQAGADPEVVDKRGLTPGHLAHKRGLPIPDELTSTLGGPSASEGLPPSRDLIVDPDSSTVILAHELCMLHRTCPPIARDGSDPPPENVRRLHVLVDAEEGILLGGEFAGCTWKAAARRAAIADVLKVSTAPTLGVSM